jgi:RNA polymerase sigma factor (TIGR02999 family)
MYVIIRRVPLLLVSGNGSEMAHADPRQDITDLLNVLGSKGQPALDRLFSLLYVELKVLARRQRRGERLDHSLNTADLIHETYLKLVGLTRTSWQNRAHFFAVAAQAMRRVLVDHARARRAQKRGEQPQRVALDEGMLQAERPFEVLLAVESALQRLDTLSPRLSRVVECRFFAGMSIEETALVMGSSNATIKRDWSLARAWLHRELKPLDSTRND